MTDEVFASPRLLRRALNMSFIEVKGRRPASDWEEYSMADRKSSSENTNACWVRRPTLVGVAALRRSSRSLKGDREKEGRPGQDSERKQPELEPGHHEGGEDDQVLREGRRFRMIEEEHDLQDLLLVI